MTKTCLFIDLENEWANSKSEYYLGDLAELKDNVERLLDFCRSKKFNIIFTRHTELGSKATFAKGSKNVELFVERKNNEILITKNKISPFFNTNLDKLLKESNTNELVICGVMTNLCVRSATSDAYDRDYKIIVIKDCCASDSKETDEFTFKDLKDTRPEIEFLTTEEFISNK